MIRAEQLRELARRASVDERTAARFLLGLKVRALARERLSAAAKILWESGDPVLLATIEALLSQAL